MTKTKLITFAFFILIFGSLFFVNAQETSNTSDQDQFLNEIPAPTEPKQEYLKANVLNIIEDGSQDVYGQIQYYQKLEIHITNGTPKNQNVEVLSTLNSPDSPFKYKSGDKVTVLRLYDDQGNEQYYITDYQRINYLLLVAAVFLILILLITKIPGILTILSLIYSILVIYYFTLPQMVLGEKPITVGVLTALIICPVIFYLTHGFNKKTTVAMLGTILSIIITLLLTYVTSLVAKLTGSATEESLFLQYTMGEDYNIKGFILVSIVIGSIGLMADAALNQSSIVKNLYETKNKLSLKEMFLTSLNQGSDHMLRAVNLMVLLVISCSLPLLVLFTKSEIPAHVILNSEIISEEIVRILLLGIGLILSVPLTTIFAIKLFTPEVTRKVSKRSSR